MKASSGTTAGRSAGTAAERAGVALQTVEVTKRFGGILAVDDVTLSIGEGELRCLIGPNGAGKSTLFKLLCGVHRPDSGRILMQGRDITRASPFRRVRLGMGIKFQNPHVYHHLTVGQNLEVPYRRRKTARFFGIAEQMFSWNRKLEVPAEELSHSELQWLEISLALACEPDILLLDEPTAGMTPEDTRITAEFVRRLNEAGLTIVVVEHDMAFVKEIGRTVTVLHQGRIFAEGTFSDISANEDVRQVYLGQVRKES